MLFRSLAWDWDCWGLDQVEKLLRPLRWGQEEIPPSGLEIIVRGKLVEP